MSEKALIVLVGASFRYGGQGSKIKGVPESVDNQLHACMTHIKFATFLKDKYNIDVEFIIYSYTTQYDNLLKDLYTSNNCKIFSVFENVLVGYNGLLRKSNDIISKHYNILDYSFIHYIRIDLFLKDAFYENFRLSNRIRFPSICWKRCSECNGILHPNVKYPRVSDMFLYIPKKHFNIINSTDFILSHNTYMKLVESGLTIDNLGFYINTYNDSDSYKDYNPLYYIVNRAHTNVWHSPNMYIDDKYIECKDNISKVVLVWPEYVNSYELDFIKELTAASNDFTEIKIVKEDPKDENIRCIYVVNYWSKTHQPYGIYNKDYGLIYLADEKITRQMDMYINDPKCKFIWRQYVNPHYHGDPKVSYIPCAYQKGFSTIKLSNITKNLLWSFAGAKHVNRVTCINTMSNAKPNYIHLTPELSFNHSSGLNLESYRKLCERSYYVLCPSGKFSMECSRLYECLEAGSIPITVKNSEQFAAEPSYYHFVFPPEDEIGPIPFIIGNTWDDCLQYVLANPEPVELTQKCSVYWKKCKAYWNKKLHIHANNLK